MSNSKDEMFNYLWKLFAKKTVESETNGKRDDSLIFTLIVLGILAFVGYEAVRVFFRKNFGMTVGNWIRVGLCVLCFAAIAVVAFTNVDSTNSFGTDSDSSDARFATGIIYSVFAITLLVKSIKDRNRHGDDLYNGDSVLLHFLKKDWGQALVQNLAEPILALTLGVVFCMFDLIGGIPLIFCALSAWGNTLFELLYQDRSTQSTVDRMNAGKNKKKFHQVNTD